MQREWDEKAVTGRSWLRVLLGSLPLVVGAIAAVAVAERVAPLRALDVYLAANPGVASGLGLMALNLAVVGTLLLLAVHFLMGAGEQDWAGRPVVQLLPVYRRRRSGAGDPRQGAERGFEAPASLRSSLDDLGGESRRMTPRQRRSFVLRLGSLCFASGVLGFVFLVGPACIRLMIIVAVVYAVGWLAWALARQR
jgi:hypothetical protein